MAQAGRRWQRTLFPWLLEFGFQQSEHDRCVFTLRRDMPTPDGPRAEHVILGVYVDDCQIAYSHGDEHSLYAQFTAAMQARWAVEDEGPIEDLLGVEFADNGDGSVTLSQTSYIERLMAEYEPDGVPLKPGETVDQRAQRAPCDASLVQHVADAQPLGGGLQPAPLPPMAMFKIR